MQSSDTQATETEVSATAQAAPALAPPSKPPASISAATAPHAPAPSGGAEPSLTTHVIVMMMMLISLVMVLWNLQDSSIQNANTGSRYATIESLVDRGTFFINKSQYVRTPDKMKVGDNFISSKPATLPTYAAGVYWVHQKLTGKNIRQNEGDVVRLVSFFTGWLFHLVFLIFFYRLCLLLIKRHLALILVMAGACFGYLGVAYATTINNHSISAALAVIGVFYAVRGRDFGDKSWDYGRAGLAFGMAAAIDLSCLAFPVIFGSYLLSRDVRRTLLWFTPALLPGLVCLFGFNYAITGSFKPTYSNSELKDFVGNYFRGLQTGIDALREPKLIYGFNVLLGHHGLFSMTPLLGFGLYELVHSARKRVRLPQAAAFAGVLLLFLGFYIFRSRNYGGWCVGMRWLVPVMPLLLLYFGLWMDRVTPRKPVIAAVLAALGVSAFHVQDGLSSPFQFSVWHNWLEGTPNRGRVGKKFNLSSKAPSKKPPKRDSRAAQ